MKIIVIIFLLFPFGIFAQQSDVVINKNIQRIAFGSCSVQGKTDQQLWNEVNKTSPDLWIWLGDNIYGDTEDMQKMRKDYQQQKSHAGYQQLLKKTDVIGVWDDHDFGVNDGGKEYPKKDESKAELFRFLDVAEDNPARSRKGAYQSYTYKGALTIKVILLDARYFRDPLKKDDRNWNIPDVNGEILGDEQWKWLEEQVQEPEVDLFIIGSGIQILPEEHRFEKWANFPRERTKFFQLLSAYVAQPVVLLSGDRHISEVSKIDLEGYDYPLYEFTSSSLTNPWGTRNPEKNRYRIKEIIYAPNFAFLDISKTEGTLLLKLTYVTKDSKVLQYHLITY